MKKISLSIFLLFILQTFCFAKAQDYSVEILADEQNFDFSKNIVHAQGNVKIRFKNLIIKGDVALYDKKRNNITISDSVKLEQDDIKLECKNIKVYLDDEKIEGENSIRFSKGDILIEGEKFELDNKKKKLIVSFNPIIKIKQENKEIILRSQDISLDMEKNIVSAKGNISFETEGLTLLGEYANFLYKENYLKITGSPYFESFQDNKKTELFADEIEYFGKDEKILAQKDVKIKHEEIRASADTLYLFNKEQRAELKGLAKAKIGKSEISADEITIFLQEKRIIAKKGVRVIAYPEKEAEK